MSPTVLPFPVNTEDKKKLGHIRVVVLKVYPWTSSIHIIWELVRKINDQGTSLVVPWVRLCTPNTGGPG